MLLVLVWVALHERELSSVRTDMMRLMRDDADKSRDEAAWVEQLAAAEKRLAALEYSETRRRRAQRTGDAQYVHILTRETRTITCPDAWSGRGRFPGERCADPAFRTCNREACATAQLNNSTDRGAAVWGGAGGGTGDSPPPGGGGGHRRAQSASAVCTADDVARRSNEVNLVCCDEPEEDCTDGFPAMCNADCAEMFLPFIVDCGGALGTAGREALSSVVERCEQAQAAASRSTDGMTSSLAVQLGVECTDGNGEEDCVPECSEELHGYETSKRRVILH